MERLAEIIGYSFLSGVTVFLGGLLSWIFETHFKEASAKEEIIHTSIAFGGGIMVAAVGFVLVPRGLDVMSLAPMVILFSAGAIFFFLLDRSLEERDGSVSQLLAMLMDFVPESVSLGAVFAVNPDLGLLLAVFIGLQNLPESFNSYIDLRGSGYTSGKCLLLLFFLSFSGVLGAVTGNLFLRDMPKVTASLMLFAGGGILYLIFQDIAPKSRLQKSWLPALGANFGFLVGMIGEKLLG